MSFFTSNALVALAAAASWGGGDFSGGMGVKASGTSTPDATTGALRVVIVAHAASLAVLATVLVATHAAVPRGAAIWWALGAGAAAGISLTAFYMALARGAMGVSAAVSGLLAAAIPALVSSALEGRPGALQIAGFALAGCAIWVIAAGPSPENEGDASRTMGLAIVGGLGFGFYFVALKLANGLGVIEPMALARTASLATCVVLLASVGLRGRGSHGRKPGSESPVSEHPGPAAIARPWLSRQAVFWAMGVALLDTGGNLLFIASTRMGRLDVAAVLASLYPASTILLAAWRLHERPTRRQVAGMFVALVAVVMITVSGGH